MTPSAAEEIDFETWLASYSDDYLNSLNTNMRKRSKHQRRRSRDDAWVNILVACRSRRVSNQDADICRFGGARPRSVSRPDPEIASLDVAQVLAGNRRLSPLPDGDSEADIEPMDVPHRSKMSNHETTPILDDIYEHTIPESEGQIEEADDEIVLQPQQQ